MEEQEVMQWLIEQHPHMDEQELLDAAQQIDELAEAISYISDQSIALPESDYHASMKT